MASITAEITHEFPQFFRVYKDGRIERYPDTDSPYVEPALDPATGVEARDVVISSEPSFKERVFMPRINGPEEKLPLDLHYHGGAFYVGSPFKAVAFNFLTSFVTLTRVIVVSVDYRLAPENPLPTPYEDSWAHCSGLKPRGLSYYEILKKSGWRGTVEFVETEGEDHCFHVCNPTCEKALALTQALASFINQD
ncbi:hypothetical protein RJ639_043717 [Escallonia herrerae]|uniref:Alpha/beta hydrolase fold-3 domain-containing protein n=1 Tax=Escallonia herrerae TaxID=1293975 RepID=A0AA89B1X7_9ASTE|nr:hypothetical protein RJ639_043717 [Escallonia herrerae]